MHRLCLALVSRADVGPFQVTAGATCHNRHCQTNFEYNPIRTVALKLRDRIVFGSGHHIFKIGGAHNLMGLCYERDVLQLLFQLMHMTSYL